MKARITAINLWIDTALVIDRIPDDELDAALFAWGSQEQDYWNTLYVMIPLRSPDEIPETLDRVEKAAAQLRKKYN